MLYYMDPNDFCADSDSGMIQQAIDEASRTGCNKVVIPAYNKRTGKFLWEISQTIKLPSHMYLEINNAHLRMADGVICQMIQNENAFLDIGTQPEGLQEDIIIQGVGRALLDGGKHNGLRETTQLQNGLPHIFHNLTIYLHHVRNFKVDGLTIRDQRWWSMCHVFCWDGIVSNIHYELTDRSYRANHPLSAEYPWRNQDGINLRVGCHDMQIMNITGQTGDDMVALTALADHGTKRFEDLYRCEHLSPDIYNVTIRNIEGYTNHCSLIRLLCHYRNQIYNISMDNIIDRTPNGQPVALGEGLRTASCIKIGEVSYHKNDPDALCRPGEMRNLRINGVFSSALSAVTLNCTVHNLTVRDIYVGETGCHALAVAKIQGGKYTGLEDPNNITDAQNIVVDGVFYDSKREDGVPFFFDAVRAKNFRIRNVSHSAKELTKYRREQADSETVIFENITAL